MVNRLVVQPLVKRCRVAKNVYRSRVEPQTGLSISVQLEASHVVDLDKPRERFEHFVHATERHEHVHVDVRRRSWRARTEQESERPTERVRDMGIVEAVVDLKD